MGGVYIKVRGSDSIKTLFKGLLAGVMKIGIIGAGLSGLSLAFMLRNTDFDVEIFEANDKIGGLLRSESIEGYTFDIGGSHILFSKDREILREMVNLIGAVVEHRRRTFIYYKGKFIKYPFENGIYMLSEEERFEILRDFFQNVLRREKGELKKPSNLLEWFYYVFGKAITEKYLKPYNEKLWKRDLRDISLEWVGNRVPNPPVEDVLKSCVGIPTEGYTHQLVFYYPLKGGIETLIRKLAESIDYPIRTNEKIKEIVYEDGKVILKASEEIVCDVVVSTAPIDTTVRLFKDWKEVKDCLASLDYNSLTVVGLGVKGKTPDFHWVYVPDRDIIFHRIAFLHNYSPNMCPENRSNILVEISRKPDEKPRDVLDEVLDGLNKMGFNFDVEVHGTWHWEYAYIVYNHNYRQSLDKLRSFLTERGVIPFGRFGNWEYLNMDAVWKNAKNLADRLKLHQ